MSDVVEKAADIADTFSMIRRDIQSVSIGILHEGQSDNIISYKVEMTGTVRTYSFETRSKMPGLPKNIITLTCSALEWAKVSEGDTFIINRDSSYQIHCH